MRRKLTEITIDPPRKGSRNWVRKESASDAKMRHKYMPQSSELTGRVHRILRQMVEEFGQSTWRYTTSDLEAHYWKKWQDGKDAVQRQLAQLKADGYGVCHDHVFDILLSHLSPFDQWSIQRNADMISGMADNIRGTLSRWRGLVNQLQHIQDVESYPFPAKVLKPVLTHAKGNIATFEKGLTYAAAAQREIDRLMPLMRKTSHNPGRRQVIRDLMPLLVKAGMSEVTASCAVRALLMAWNPDGIAGSDGSIRATYQKMKPQRA